MTYKIFEVCTKISIMPNIYAMPESGIIENRLSEAARTWQFPAKKRYNGGNCKTFCHPPMLVLKNVIRKAGSQVTRRRFTDIPGLIRDLYAGLVESLENRGALATRPFDDSLCSGATLKDIANEQVTSFIETAEAKGRLALKGSRAPKAVLQNFNLLRDSKPTNAAMLLFGKNPRQFFNNAQVHCFHFHGTEKQKPIASQQT